MAADQKLSEQDFITSAELSSDDLLYVADMSVPKTKKMTVGQLDSRFTSAASGTAMAQAITILENVTESLDGRVTVLEEEVSTLSSTVSGFDGRITAVEEMVSELEGTVSGFDGRITAVEELVDELNGTVTGFDGRITACEEGLIDVQGQIDNISESLGDFQNILQALRDNTQWPGQGMTSFTAPPGLGTKWLLANGDTIGDGSSGATHASGSDAFMALFFALWEDPAYTSVLAIYTSSGDLSTRGANATEDYDAHKRLALPNVSGLGLRMPGTQTVGGRAKVGPSKGEARADKVGEHTHGSPPNSNNGTLSAHAMVNGSDNVNIRHRTVPSWNSNDQASNGTEVGNDTGLTRAAIVVGETAIQSAASAGSTDENFENRAPEYGMNFYIRAQVD